MTLLEAAIKMLLAYDKADDTGLFSDHGDHKADLTECPGCALDVASEDLREAIKSRGNY